MTQTDRRKDREVAVVTGSGRVIGDTRHTVSDIAPLQAWLESTRSLGTERTEVHRVAGNTGGQ